jgi:5'-nucleotidase
MWPTPEYMAVRRPAPKGDKGESTIRILVANDDGVLAPGLWALVEELMKVGDVLVAAPDREQSGQGTAVTLTSPVRVTRMTHAPLPVETYSVHGTPGDCVILGLQALAGGPVDLVVSGINEGANLGGDVLISGTVGAALQGLFHDTPSIAISVGTLHAALFQPAARLAAIMAQDIDAGRLPKDALLNVNLPSRPVEELAGIVVTRLARRRPAGLVEPQKDNRGKMYYWLQSGQTRWVTEEGTDLWAMRNGLVSITPLESSLTGAAEVAMIEAACPALFARLRG